MTPRTYLVHGLSVHSTLCLEPAPAAARPADVVVTYVEGPIEDEAPAGNAARWNRHADGAELVYEADGHRLTFAYSQQASRIDIRCSRPGCSEAVAGILAGPGMAALLSLRGVLVFHAAAVVVGGKAVLILGDSGSGKSTLTGALIDAGGRFLTEEVTAVRRDDDGFVVTHGVPWISFDRPGLPGKRYRHVSPEALFQGCAPVGVAYQLGHRTRAVAPSIEPVELSRIAPILLRSIYNRSAVTPGVWLDATARLATSIEVCELRMPDDLATLPVAAASVLADAARRVAR